MSARAPSLPLLPHIPLPVPLSVTHKMMKKSEEEEEEGKERSSAPATAAAAAVEAAGNLAYVMRPDEASGGMAWHGGEREGGREGGRQGRAAAKEERRKEEGRSGEKVANQIGKKKKEKGESFLGDDGDGDGDERPDEETKEAARLTLALVDRTGCSGERGRGRAASAAEELVRGLRRPA